MLLDYPRIHIYVLVLLIENMYVENKNSESFKVDYVINL